jgi:hypothetical protein
MKIFRWAVLGMEIKEKLVKSPRETCFFRLTKSMKGKNRSTHGKNLKKDEGRGSSLPGRLAFSDWLNRRRLKTDQ